MKQATGPLIASCRRCRHITRRTFSVGGVGAAAVAVVIYTASNDDERRTNLLSSPLSLSTRSSYSNNNQEDDDDNDNDNDDAILASFERIPVDFVHKLAQKFYLQTLMPGILDRPPAIPRTLRLLTIDLPEVAEQGIAVGGKCYTILDQYPAGVAPPRKRLILPASEAQTANVDVDAANVAAKTKAAPKHRHPTMEIQQKAWVQAYLQCTSSQKQLGHAMNDKSKKPSKKQMPNNYSFDKGPPEDVGVEIMQASMITLNPRHLRKIHTFIPGSADAFADNKTSDKGPIDEASRTDVQHSRGSRRQSSSAASESKNNLKTKSQLTKRDELDAPWNQYAWIEELTLRIHGRVHFGAPLQRARRHSFFLSRLYYSSSSGNQTITKSYRTTIPSARPWWETWFIPPFLLRTDPEGIDGGLQYTDTKNQSDSSSSHSIKTINNNNWASNKPHAVVANGATLHRVPNALRLLQKTCKDANVPLYVIRDPRKWGGNTHETLGDVLQDLRVQLKHQFVTASLQFAAGKAFARGRWLGQMETNATWHARQAAEWMQRAEEERKLKRERNWSRISDVNVLEEKLHQHRLVQRVNRSSSPPASSSSSSSTLSSSEEDSSTIDRVYSEGMIAFCQRCVAEVGRQETKSAAIIEEEESEVEVNDDETPTEATL